MEPTLLWAALTGVACAWLFLRLPETRRRLPHSIDRPLDLLVVSAIAGLLTGRLAAMIRAGVDPLTSPLDILLVRGGVDTGFAALGAAGLLTWLTRREIPAALDALAPSIVAGMAGWHAGCLWRDACLGSRSDLPWAWAPAGSTVTRHPVELYAALLLLAVAVAMTRMPPRPRLASGTALAAVSGARLLTEPFRLGILGGPVAWYATGLILGAGIVVWSLASGASRPRS